LRFQRSLFENLDFQFDPAASVDGTTLQKEGGFVLYRKDQRIDQFTLFQDLITQLITKAEKKVRPNHHGETLQNLKEILLNWVQTDEFLIIVLLRYHQPNQLMADLSSNYQKLEFPPWITRAGNKTQNV